MAFKSFLGLLALVAVAAALTDSQQEVLDSLLKLQADEVRVKRGIAQKNPSPAHPAASGPAATLAPLSSSL